MGTWQSAMKQIERKRKNIGKKNGFDFSFISKKQFPTNPENGRPFYCKWSGCVQPMYMAGIDRKDGSVILSCETDDCIGNVDTPEHIVKKKLKALGLDTKLNFNGRKSMLNKMTNQQWMDKYNPP